MPVDLVCRTDAYVELRLIGWIGDEHDPDAIWLRDLRAHLDGFTGAVLIRINSRGGYLEEAFVIYRFLRELPAAVTVRIEILAASAASLIAMAGRTVEIEQTALLMIHAPSMFAPGDHAGIAGAVADAERALAEMAGIYASRSKRSLEDERSRLLSCGDLFLSADEAVAAGYADACVAPWWSVSPAKAT